MPTVTLTSAACDAVRAKALKPFDDSDLVPRGDGKFDVRISVETYDRILHIQMPGETVSETLLRILAGPRYKLS